MKAKHILFFLIFIGLNFTPKAQSNLQFNQVVQQSFSPAISPAVLTAVGTIVVPTGKVWKIEHVGLAHLSTNSNGLNSARMFIGGQCVSDYSTSLKENISGPLWLKSGTYSIEIYHNSSSSVVCYTSYSGIEFNIVP
jgi:hypothetical protein